MEAESESDALGTQTQPLRTLGTGTDGRPTLRIPAGVRRPLGSSGLSVFPLMLGGAEFGWNIDREAGFAVMDRFVEQGGNALHTADSFGAGRSEYILGQWIASRRVRDDIVLSVRVGGHPDNPGLGSVNLVRAAEASLSRLQTDHIDVLSLDASTDSVAALEDTLATAEWLVETGKARAIGVHGFTATQIVEARILCSAGYPRIDVLDVAYNLMRRKEYEGDLRLVAGAQGLAVTPSHALEHGFLSGLHRSKAGMQPSTRTAQLTRHMNRRGTKTLRVLDAVSTETGLSHAAVAIAWLLAQRQVAAPIVNPGSPEQVDQLIEGVQAHLGRGHLTELAKAVT